MSQPAFRFQNINQPIGLQALDGSIVGVTETGRIDTVGGPPTRTEHGVAIGPLELQPYADTAVVLERFGYEPTRAAGPLGGWSPLAVATLPAVAVAEDDEHDLSRRDVLKLGAAAGGLLALSEPVAAAERPLLDVAEVELVSNPRGVTLQVWDRVPEVLNITERYHITVNGAEIGTFDPPDGDYHIPPGVTGTVSVHADAEASFWDEVRGWVGGPSSVHEFEFKLDQDASEYDAGSVVELTAAPQVVAPLREAGGGNATLTIGGTSIPHREEGDTAAGHYFVTADDVLVYAAGKDPPTTQLVTIRIDVGAVSEALDDASRSFQF